MKKMFTIYGRCTQMAFAASVNRLLYFYKRIPALGKLLPDTVYSLGGLKHGAAIVTIAASILRGLLAKTLYLGLMVMMPLFVFFRWIPEELRPEAFVHLFFFLSFIGGTFQSSSLLSTDINRYTCVKLMAVSPREYVVPDMIVQILCDFLFFLPGILVSYGIMGSPLWQGSLLMLLLIAFRLIGEWLHLQLFHRKRILLIKKYGLQLLVLIGFAGLGYFLLQMRWILPVKALLYSPLMIVIFGLAAISFIKILKYPHFKSDILACITPHEAMLSPDAYRTEAQFKRIRVREEEFSDEALKQESFREKTGYEYLNALFFQRHRRLIMQPLQKRLFIILIACSILCLGIFFFPGFKVSVATKLVKTLPALVLIMYFISVGERVCKAMFVNCDISLLRYGFYRKKEVILKNFIYRLKKIAGLNLILGAAICAAFLLLNVFAGAAFSQSIVLYCISIICLSIFFSVHHLFLYYVFQPYTTELSLKNPMFRLLNWLVYIGCYSCLWMRDLPAYFTVLVIFCTLFYIIIALFCVYKFAPKNFRIK